MIAWVDEKGQISDTPPDPSKKEEVKAENIEIGVPKDNSEEGDKILTGEIKKFDNSKGFGFIYCSDLRQDVFVHINDCNGPVDAGDKVEFDVEKGVKGLKAINVNPV